jgi:hypothetical protein
MSLGLICLHRKFQPIFKNFATFSIFKISAHFLTSRQFGWHDLLA